MVVADQRDLGEDIEREFGEVEDDADR